MKNNIQCSICHSDFKTIPALSRHIKCHRILSQQYYDKYLKKENDGSCLYCGKQTTYKNLKHGYCTYCNTACQGALRHEILEKVKKENYLNNLKDKKIFFECEICGFRLTTKFGASAHLGFRHSISTQDYYDKYLLKDEKEKLCRVCGGENRFISIHQGYTLTCCRACSDIDEIKMKKLSVSTALAYEISGADILKRQKETNIKKFGVDNYSKTKESREAKSLFNSLKIIEGGFQFNNGFKTGHFTSIKNKKEMFYRSSYELVAFKLLEKDLNVETFEDEPFRIPYKTKDDITRHYIPDILITYVNGSKELIEVKPQCFVNEESVKLKIQAGLDYCLANDMIFNVWTEKELEI